MLKPETQWVTEYHIQICLITPNIPIDIKCLNRKKLEVSVSKLISQWTNRTLQVQTQQNWVISNSTAPKPDLILLNTIENTQHRRVLHWMVQISSEKKSKAWKIPTVAKKGSTIHFCWLPEIEEKRLFSWFCAKRSEFKDGTSQLFCSAFAK